MKLAAAPSLPSVKELRAPQAEQENRGISAPVGDVLDEVEERLLAPVDVIPHDHEWSLTGCLFEELPDSECDLIGCRLLVAAKQRRKWPYHCRRQVALVGPQRLHYLNHRPIRDALAVREAAAADDSRVELLQNLCDEPRLADARGPEQREQVTCASRGGEPERVTQ